MTVVADRSVRPARPGDVTELARVHREAWLSSYAGVLPPDVLAEVATADLAARWRQAVTGPPSPRHHVLVALEGGAVVGVATVEPATDADADPLRDGELGALLVDPGHMRGGHGSRLLAAAVDVLRADGARRALSWVLEDDAVLRRFLEGAGWAADGARRHLDMGEPVAQIRLNTDLGTEET